jgi:hypothetical protein
VLSSESLTNLLLEIATGYPDRARDLLETSEEIDGPARTVLIGALATEGNESILARRLGDGLRSLGADRSMVNECYRVAFYAGEDWKALSGNPLFAFFAANKGGKPLDKWIHYFPIYDRHLAPYRGSPIRVLEIGVSRGGGLEMLRQYLGAEAHVVGIDIDEAARVLAGPGFEVEVGDQADAEFLTRVSRKHGPFDVVIDDGGHTMRQQIISVETLFPLLTQGATYLVEDCHTSYWPEYSGGGAGGQTFLAWVRDRIDDLNAHHFSRDLDLAAPWQTELGSLHVYDSVVILDKSRRFAPFCEASGTSAYINSSRLSVTTETELIATRKIASARAANATAEAEARMAAMAEEVTQARSDLKAALALIRIMRRSKSWSLAAPIRAAKRMLRRQ